MRRDTSFEEGRERLGLRVGFQERGEPTMSDWRERLKADPRGTVLELLERFAAGRGADPEVEDLFWRAFADHGTPEEIARGVLGRLRVGGEEGLLGLLDLDREHRVRLRGRLRMAAADALAAFVRDPEERATIEAHPARLPEAAFERRGRPREAAALYALEHDRLVPDDGAEEAGAGSAEELLGRAALRYALARVLRRIEGEAERALAVMESVVALLEEGAAAGEPAPVVEEGSLPWRLSFHAREWLGLRHYEAGRYRRAVGEFLRAAESAPDTDLELAARIFAANALIRSGRQEEARSLLDGLRERTAGGSRDLSEEWDVLWRRLLDERGEEE